MSQYYTRRERERDYGTYGEAEYDQEPPEDYSNHYKRVPRAARNSNSFSPPTAGSNYEFSRQRSWAGSNSAGSGGRSYEERERGFSHSYSRDRERDPDGYEYSSSPRTPTYDARGVATGVGAGAAGTGVGGGGGSSAGSTARRSRDMASSPRYETRSSPRERERERERDRERDRDRERVHDRDYYHQREKRQERARQRMRHETKNYPRRLREYLLPILQSQDAMDHAVEVFVKLEEDARYLTRSVGALLESLAAVADVASSAKGGDGTGLDDPHTDSELTEDSALEDSETAAESADSDDDDQNAADLSRDGSGGSTVGVGASIGIGNRRRSSAAAYGNGGSNGSSSNGNGNGSSNGEQRRRSSMDTPPVFMQWAGFQPYALSKAPEGVNDRRKSFLALTQTIGVSLLTLNMEAASLPRGKSGSNGSNGTSHLSTKGLLSELVRVLQPHDYRAYFRAAARVILLPATATLRRPDEIALEALERQLLGTAKFGQAMSGAPMNGTAVHGAAPMVACLTYSSGNYGSISLYRLDIASTREGGDWPRRIQPVSVMTSVPKELLRRSVRAMPPSRRTVLKIRSAVTSEREKEKTEKEKTEKNDKNDKNDKADKNDKNGEAARLRWVSLPGDTTAPSLGYSPNVGRSTLSGSLRTALGIEAEDLKVGSGTTANIVNATVPAMLAWLHVRAAYLTGVEFEATEVQRSSSGSKSSSSSSSARERDDASSVVSQRPRMRRIIRCKRAPTPIEHEGRDPCIVVLHPSRGDWVTTPVYWTEVKE